MLTAWFLLTLSLAHADPCTATFFEIGSAREKPVLKWERKERQEAGQLLVDLRTIDLKGAELLREEVVLKDFKVLRYSLDQKQLGEKGSVEVAGGKVKFSYTKEGKTRTDEEDLPNNLVVGANLADFARAHWDELMKGDTVPMRFAVLDRVETVGFKLFTIEDKAAAQAGRVVVKMKPSSFVIAALVDPLLLTFEKDRRRLVQVIGRTLAKRQTDKGYKDLDVESVYTYAN